MTPRGPCQRRRSVVVNRHATGTVIVSEHHLLVHSAATWAGGEMVATVAPEQIARVRFGACHAEDLPDFS